MTAELYFGIGAALGLLTFVSIAFWLGVQTGLEYVNWGNAMYISNREGHIAGEETLMLAFVLSIGIVIAWPAVITGAFGFVFARVLTTSLLPEREEVGF